MCTRFVLEGAAARAGFSRLGLDALAAAVDAALERFNIAPGTELTALRVGTKPGTARAFRPRWGFVPVRAEGDAATLLVNARAETLAVKPMFREAFRRRRCLVPATGYYEWEKRGRARLPWLFRAGVDAGGDGAGAPFAFAGLWEPAGEEDANAATVLVTTGANALMARVHERMPVLLTSPEACRAWLDTRTDEAVLRALCAPVDAAAARMTATPVSPRMNRADFDSPECVRPAVHGVAAREGGEEDGELAF
jgi:putative SOS response-associated peptidase YedK